MSILDGCKPVVIDEWNGVKPIADVVDITPGDALVALNCEFSPGKVGCRTGFAPAFTAGTVISPYYYAYGDPTAVSANYLAFLDGSSHAIRSRDLNAGTNYDLKTSISSSAQFASFASEGKRLYASVTKYPYAAISGAYVWDGDTSHTMDDCFQRPMKTTEVTLGLTQPGAGVCTAGAHNVGVLFETRSGYWTRPGPVDSSLVLQAQTITSTGTNNIRATLTPASTWPTWIKAVQLIYTSVLNNFQYYVVPGTITAITAGSATVYTIDFSVADIQIRAIGSQGAGTLADDYFSLLSMDASNNAAFNVKFQLVWGDRIVWFGNYGGVDCFFPSEPNNPEWISADQHCKQLPSGLPVGASFVLRGVLYVISSSGGIFGYTDNGGRPVNFAPPQTIDSRLSCKFPPMATVSASGGTAFVMTDQGLYSYSGGAFPQIPMSYYQTPDIKTYGLALGYGVKDFSSKQTVFVQGLDSANHAMLYSFNYQAGFDPKRIKASPWTFNASMAVVPSGAHIEAVLNPSTSGWEMWMASPEGGMLRQKALAVGSLTASDVALYTDASSATSYAVDQQYQTSVLPPNPAGAVLNHLGGRIRAVKLQPTQLVFSASKAAAAVITTANIVGNASGSHGLTAGTTLTVTISGATGAGWTALNATWTPTVLSLTTFSIPLDTSAFTGSAAGTIVITYSGFLAVSVKDLDGALSVTPAASPLAITAAPGKRYEATYDLQGENASYLFTNGAVAGNAVMIAELAHFSNLFATSR